MLKTKSKIKSIKQSMFDISKTCDRILDNIKQTDQCLKEDKDEDK